MNQKSKFQRLIYTLQEHFSISNIQDQSDSLLQIRWQESNSK